MQKLKTLILGAGIAGLCTAYFLEKNNQNDYLLIEAQKEPGGLARSVRKNGFIFDFAIHALYLKTREVADFVTEMIGDQLIKKDRVAGILFQNKIVPYPFQRNLYFLENSIKQECLSGVLEAKANFNEAKKYKNFKDWIYSNLGSGIAKHFMMPYNRKCYNIEPDELTPDCIGRYLPKPDFEEIIKGAEKQMPISDKEYNYQFHYIKDGGIDLLPKAIFNKIKNTRLDEQVVEINVEEKVVKTTRGEYAYKYLVNSIPMNNLIKIINNVPEKIKKAGEKIRSNCVCAILLGINREKISEHQWIYLPEEKILPYRISFPMNMSEKTVPQGCSSICAEYSFIDRKLSNEEIIERVIDDLTKIGIIKEKTEIIFKEIVLINPGYIIYDSNRKNNIEIIQEYLNKQNIFSIGEFGTWEHSSMNDAIDYGRKTAQRIINIRS